MTKQEFLSELRRLTGALTEQERARLAEYYSEMIDDRVEEGVPEEEAVAALGDPADIAREFASDGPREASGNRSETVAALRSLRVHVANADVTVIREDLASGAAAQLRFSDPQRFDWRMNGDTLEVLERKLESGHRGLEFGLRWLKQMITEPDLQVTIALSQGLSNALDFEGGIGIDLHTHSGDVKLTDVSAANLMLHAASGDIAIRDLALSGRLRLQTASGDIELRDVESDEASITTASGDIELDRGRTGVTEVRTASGDVRLVEAEADPELQVESASGDIGLVRCIARHARVKSVSGDVDLRLEPLPCGYDLLANSVSGSIHFGDGLTDGNGDPQPKLVVSTVSGDIEAKLAR